jgi:recombination associated protein RdgC
MTHAISDATWIAVGGEDKILPGAVVNDLLSKKLAEIEEREGRRPGGRARKRLKEELLHDLLPRAFVRPVRTDAILDAKLGLLAVDTSSRKSAEAVASEVRTAIGSFPALPLNAEVAPRSVLTGWIAGEPLPEGLSLGDECELRDPADTGAVVKVQRMELSGEEIAKHLESGKQVARLALVLDDHASFVLGDDLVVRKFKLLDGAVDQLESTDRDDVKAELDARFALMSGELRRLFAVLEPALKLSKVDG